MGELDGAGMIGFERQRQISIEGWTSAHDDEHTTGQIALAAASYAHPSPPMRELTFMGDLSGEVPEWWPWDAEWWKPTGDRIADLVKAGALIAAEIDRLSRIKKQGGGG